MANTKQAAKRAKKSVKQRAANMSLRTTLRTAIKKVQKAIATGDQAPRATGARSAAVRPSTRWPTSASSTRTRPRVTRAAWPRRSRLSAAARA